MVVEKEILGAELWQNNCTKCQILDWWRGCFVNYILDISTLESYLMVHFNKFPRQNGYRLRKKIFSIYIYIYIAVW